MAQKLLRVGEDGRVQEYRQVPQDIVDALGFLPAGSPGQVQEFAFNSSTSVTNDTTHFGHGSSGAWIRAFSPSGNTAVVKRVRFLEPIRSTDLLMLELHNGVAWVDAGSVFGGVSSGLFSKTGVMLSPVSARDVDVLFFSAPMPRDSWRNYTSWSWRVRRLRLVLA